MHSLIHYLWCLGWVGGGEGRGSDFEEINKLRQGENYVFHKIPKKEFKKL